MTNLLSTKDSVDSLKPGEWSSFAACRDHDPELWDPDPDPEGPDGKTKRDPKAVKMAVSICKRECPVLEECLAEGLKSSNLNFLIMGGLLPRDRQAIHRRSRRK